MLNYLNSFGSEMVSIAVYLTFSFSHCEASNIKIAYNIPISVGNFLSMVVIFPELLDSTT